ncbi:protein-disulfide reductase DsbD domain-containing protein [Neomegalonema sp.]|uniref:protein-disulfide reductase DsbD domain-containing protein n=1 Tax=Neomegalonema sp. TaxID=2039713 RepID=UPI00262CECF7|nr:protein-disulfide reductase DsbD domain-containing protein [Neomegalonema sp.]MDD2868064.1 protein-disulfide reductase DsbD family protein [Neomegalonema sp.]
MTFARSALAALLLTTSAPGGAALAGGWVEADVARVRLLEGEARNATELRAALDIELKEGWKTYWRAPGSTGVAPEFDWSGSTNLKSAEVLWPRPRKLESAGAEFWGYDSHLALPIRVTPEDPTKPVDLDVQIYFGVCRDICTPLDLEVRRSLTGEPASTEESRRIAEAETLVPPDGEAAGVALGEAKLIGEGIRRSLEIRLAESGSFEAPEAIFAGPPSLVVGPVEVSREGDDMILRAQAMAFGKRDWEGAPISVTLLEGPFAAEARGEIKLVAAAP